MVLSTGYINVLIPFEWVWGWIFKKHEMNSTQFIVEPLIQINSATTEDQLAIGLVEIFAGAFLCIIPHPIAYSIGSGFILDGTRRIFDGTSEVSEKNGSIQYQKQKTPEYSTFERYQI